MAATSLLLILTACQSITVEPPAIVEIEHKIVAPPKDGPIVVAVYSFQDKTGQRKDGGNLAHRALRARLEADVAGAQRRLARGQGVAVVVGVDAQGKDARRQPALRSTFSSGRGIELLVIICPY